MRRQLLFRWPLQFNVGFATNCWAAAAAAAIQTGNYSATAPGGVAGATGAGTTFGCVFNGLAAGSANGTWTLSITDGGGGDTGTITAATLFINETAPVSLQNFSVD